MIAIGVLLSLFAASDPGIPAPLVDSPILTRTPAPISPPSSRIGLHLMLDDGRRHWSLEVWPEHMSYAGQVLGDWAYVVQVIRLDDLNPARWQVWMDLCAELRLTPVLRLATVYDHEAGLWTAPPQDPDGTYRTIADQYAAFIMALDWPTDEHLIIVGNEPNHGEEWGGKPDPAAYARFLIDVADTLHAADPGVRILNAGFDPYAPHTGAVTMPNGMFYLDEESFLDGMINAYPDVFARLDIWASHSYPLGPFSEPPWRQEFKIDTLDGATNPDHRSPPPGIHNRGINGYEWELWKLETLGIPPLPVLITETGWRHSDNTEDNAATLPDAHTAAGYIELALCGSLESPSEGWIPWLDDPRVIGVVFFALNGYPSEWGHSNWLRLDDSGTVLGTYPMFERVRAIGCN